MNRKKNLDSRSKRVCVHVAHVGMSVRSKSNSASIAVAGAIKVRDP
jgi:hypothetical protein